MFVDFLHVHMAPALRVVLHLALCHAAVFAQKLELYPKNPLFRLGDSRALVCRMRGCSGTAAFSWSSVLDKPLHAEPRTSPSDSTLVFRSVQEYNENLIQCKAACQGKLMQANAKIRVYSFPNDPVVSGHERMVSGQGKTLTCNVSDVYPAERMSVEWLRGGRVVHTQEGEYGFKTIQSYFTITPQPNDTEPITCRATLGLDDLPPEERVRETTVSMTVLSHSLKVSLQPDSSRILVKSGSSMMLTCNSSGCPHADIAWRDVKHHTNLSQVDTQTFTSQLGPWTVGPEDNRTFICDVTCGSAVKSKRTQLKVFSFPSDPTIEISGPFLEGKITNLTCTVHDVFPVDSFYMQWMSGETEVQAVRGNSSDKLQNLSLTIPFKPKYSDPNMRFTCRVSLKIEGVSSQKSASTTLAVHYSPKHTTVDVRPQKKLNEGEAVTISCQTNSVPQGHVTLSRVVNGEETELISTNGTQTSFSISFTNESHSGIYVCEAVNRYGHQRESVQITVQAAPRNLSLSVYASAEEQEVESASTVCCQLTSFTPSNVALRKLDSQNDITSSDDGTVLLLNLTADDTDLEQANTTSIRGLNVISKKKDDGDIYSSVFKRMKSVDFIIPVSCLGVLATVISTLHCVRNAKRKGFYKLSEGIP